MPDLNIFIICKTIVPVYATPSLIREGAIVCPDTIRALFPLPIERNGNEAEKFSDECWEKGLRLDKSPSVHYQLLMETIRWTLIPQQK